MYELPLFPLNTVLFPNAPLRLHIFEDRYKRMIRLCLQNNQPFGVVLIRRGVEALGPLAEPFPIGCTARIEDVQNLSGGRMNILAVGGERFRILTLNRATLPYLVANVENYPFDLSDMPAVRAAGERLRGWVARYLRMMIEAGQTQLESGSLPEDAAPLAYLAASLVQTAPLDKQRLLSLHSVAELLDALHSLYRREVVLLREMLAERAPTSGAFSAN